MNEYEMLKECLQGLSERRNQLIKSFALVSGTDHTAYWADRIRRNLDTTYWVLGQAVEVGKAQL